MLNVLAFLVDSNALATALMIIRYALAVLILVCAGFIVFVVMKQSGNTDGTEAFTGSNSQKDDNESFYGKNKGKSKEAKLKMWTYICAGILAVASIVFLIIG